MMPIQTTACRPNALPRSEPFWPASWSSSMAFADLAQVAVGVLIRGDGVEDLAGQVLLALDHQEARGLGQRVGDPAVEHGGHGGGQEHPAPGLDAQPESLVRAAGDVANRASDSRAAKIPVVMASCCSDASRPRTWRGEISEMYAGAITEARPMPSPPTRRQKMRSQTLKAEAGADGADQEQQCPQLHGGDAAVAVGHLAGQVRARRAAQQGNGHGEAGHGLAECELVLHRIHGAVDHGGVEAEQEAAHGAGKRQPDHPLGDLGRLSAPGSVDMVLPWFGGSGGCGANVVGCGTGPVGRRTRA
jgi:hypothetical protein